MEDEVCIVTYAQSAENHSQIQDHKLRQAQSPICFPLYPVLQKLPELIEALRSHPVVVLQAPPGTGKSTVLPLHLLADFLMPEETLLMLEPRRLAARAIASRMAELQGEAVGETIGYQVRFEKKAGANTRIHIVTDGIMTRLMQSDPSLEGVKLVIFDEFHERSLQADLALALCRDIQEGLRDDLRILIMSATLDAEALSEQFQGAPIISVESIAHPVEIFYKKDFSNDNGLRDVVPAITRALKETTGDILVFLPGGGEISKIKTVLETSSLDSGTAVYPLFGDMPLSQQALAIQPDRQGRRKIILATSIAETSLTIDGVSVVIDSGLQRLPFFEPSTGLTRMETVRVTADAADQRAGRAGRQGPGRCYRLWTSAEQHQLQVQRRPEIAESDLASMVLELAQWGITDWKKLRWVTPPPTAAWFQAKELLTALEALDAKGHITERGRQMSALPVHPRLAHMLLSAKEDPEKATLLPLAIDLAALLEERDLFPRGSGTDVSLRVDTLRKFRAGEPVLAERALLERVEKIAKTWRTYFNIQADNTRASMFDIGRLLAEAYPERIAQIVDAEKGRFRLRTGNYATLAAADHLIQQPWIVAAHVDSGAVKAGGNQEGRIYLAAPLHENEVQRFSADRQRIFWDEAQERVVAVKEKHLGPLILESKEIQQIPETERIALLLEIISEKGFQWSGFQEAFFNFCNRVESLRIWRPEEDWPEMHDAALKASLVSWLGPFLEGVKNRAQLQQVDAIAAVKTRLPWTLQTSLASLAPEKLAVPSGSHIALQYFPDGRPPVMEVRLQELFGLAETPRVNDGRVPIMLHLLSPGFKPVQVTQDLKSFWNTTYFDVRKELRMRYPKHSWPDDPWTAEAVRGAKRRG